MRDLGLGRALNRKGWDIKHSAVFFGNNGSKKINLDLKVQDHSGTN